MAPERPSLVVQQILKAGGISDSGTQVGGKFRKNLARSSLLNTGVLSLQRSRQQPQHCEQAKRSHANGKGEFNQ
jgi:hypothetical protein